MLNVLYIVEALRHNNMPGLLSGKNTPARSHCSFGEPVHQIDGDSDWCGFGCLIASCQSRGHIFLPEAIAIYKTRTVPYERSILV